MGILLGHHVVGWRLVKVFTDVLLVIFTDAIHRYSNVHDNPQDVAFSMFEADEIVVGTVGDDGILALWDLRQDTPVAKVVASDHPLNSLSFSSRSSHLIAVGGNEKDVALYDCRKLNSCLHKMSGHEKTINRVSFNPHNSNIIASCSDDRRVKLWDVSRIGMEQAAADAEDGPPELLFGHGGHTEGVSDISWNPESKLSWVVASVGEDNRLQVWIPAQVCIEAEEDDPLAVDDATLE
eukprot:GHVN01028852.1.p1 GENE.GHVN01028852.1~~GHVN01028852.1.p1  ORF type:complete len:237 (+),score=23.16 GHVN01028852.1:1065-1775(+)